MRRFSIAPVLTCLGLTIIALPASAAQDPHRTPGVTCTAGGMSSPPQFTQVSPGRAEYHFSGACVTREGQSLAYRIDGTWTPNEKGGNANASEVYHVDRVSGPSESFTALVGWRCDSDPWRFDAQCVRVGNNIPTEPYAFWEQFGRDLRPSSRRALSAEDRVALQADYDRANRGRQFRSVSDSVSAETRGTGYAQPSPGTTRDPVRRNTLDDAALNPQPLPPEPDPDPNQPTLKTTTPAKDSAELRSIIIVGGKTRAPAVKTTATRKAGGG